MKKKWREIEVEALETEGYIIVPTDGSFSKYAAQGPNELFDTVETAQRELDGLVRRGVVAVGEVKIIQARLVQHRRLEVIDRPVLFVVEGEATGA